MPLTPQDFVSKWKRAEARERQSVQEHFLDLCALAGHETAHAGQPEGHALRLRDGRSQDQRQFGLGRRGETGVFRLGVQGQRLGRRQSLRAIIALSGCAAKPAPADRLRHQQDRHPHQLHQPGHAHQKLDQAVFAAYGWPSDLSDEEILARLLSLNLERSGK